MPSVTHARHRKSPCRLQQKIQSMDYIHMLISTFLSTGIDAFITAYLSPLAFSELITSKVFFGEHLGLSCVRKCSLSLKRIYAFCMHLHRNCHQSAIQILFLHYFPKSRRSDPRRVAESLR